MYKTNQTNIKAIGKSRGDTTQNQLQSIVLVSLSTRNTKNNGKPTPELIVTEFFELSDIVFVLLANIQFFLNLNNFYIFSTVHPEGIPEALFNVILVPDFFTNVPLAATFLNQFVEFDDAYVVNSTLI